MCIWNRAIIECGFPIGQPIRIITGIDGLSIVPAAESRRKVSGVLNHGNRLPVIDLKETGSLSLSGLGEIGDEVIVNILTGEIRITKA